MNYEPKLHIVLYHPEIPYNAGNIGRSCVAVGAKLWMVKPLGFEVTDYYLRRAGMDYWPLLEVEIVEDWQELTTKLAGHRFWFFTKKATQLYTKIQYQPSDVLVFGCESAGLPDEFLQQHPDQLLKLPMREQVRSLNLSNCAAILMYEALRQWEA